MISQDLLSNDQRKVITSQTEEIPNPSEQRKRIAEKVEHAFNLFDLILKSPIVSQKYKDDQFEESKVRTFLSNFARYDNQNLPSEEANKQRICKLMVSMGLDYFKSRYKKMQLIAKNVDQATSLLNAIDLISQETMYDDDVMKMYKARSRSVRPQLIIAQKDFWGAECKHCYNTSQNAKTEKEAIRNLKHTKHCLYTIDMKRQGGTHRDTINQQYIIIYPPRD